MVSTLTMGIVGAFDHIKINHKPLEYDRFFYLPPKATWEFGVLSG